MSWLFEQPLVIVPLGLVAALVLGGLWTATGRKEFLFGAAMALVLLVAGVVTERLVVTDREAIRATLRVIASDVKRNDQQALVRHIHNSAPQLKQKALAEMPRYKFDDCRITSEHLIDVDASADPRSAIAEFNVVASGTFTVEGLTVTTTTPRWVRLQLLRDSDSSWKVVDYEHAEPQRMIMQDPSATPSER